MYRWGLAKGYVMADPTAGTEGYSSGQPRNRVLAPDEIKTFWAWLNAGSGENAAGLHRCAESFNCASARACRRDCRDRGLRTRPKTVTDCFGRSQQPAQRTKTNDLRRWSAPPASWLKQALEHHQRGPLFKTALSDRALTGADVGHGRSRSGNYPARSLAAMICAAPLLATWTRWG